MPKQSAQAARRERISTVPRAELENLRIHYVRAGSGGPELLFIPGWCCDHTAFQPQFDHFSRTHTVTAIDPRGCGHSDAPSEGYGIRDFADDLAEFCTVVGIEKPVLVGHSHGAMVAVEVGARYPLLPSALVLVDPGPIDPLPATVKFSLQRRSSSRGRAARTFGGCGSRTLARAMRRSRSGSST